MISAFGVEHGISKSYTQLRPKLLRNFQTQPWGPSMQERMRANYTASRLQAGHEGKRGNIEAGKEAKAFNRASMTGIANSSRRRKRYLP